MKVLWLFAHPDQRSLSGALKDEGLRTLDARGHQHRVSDLYAMKWNPVVDAADYGHDPADRLLVGEASERAYTEGHLAPDIRAEQHKLDWADTLIVQFPLWWYGMPAILKGWFDRVFVKGFAFGLTDPATGRPSVTATANSPANGPWSSPPPAPAPPPSARAASTETSTTSSSPSSTAPSGTRGSPSSRRS